MNEPLSFEQHVVDSLARLETSMDTLTGSAGRVTKLEDKVFKVIIAVVVLAVLVLGPAAVMAALR